MHYNACTSEQCHLTSEQSDTLYLQRDLSPCQECAMRIESRFAVAISAEVGLRVGLPRHMHNQFFVHIVDSGHSQGSDCVHCTSVGHPHSITYSTSNPLFIVSAGQTCYLRQPQALCVHCSGVPLTDLMSYVAVLSSGCV